MRFFQDLHHNQLPAGVEALLSARADPRIRDGKRLGTSTTLPRTSAGDSVIFVTLGSFDLEKNTTKVNLEPYKAKLLLRNVCIETDLVLAITTDPESDQEYRVPLSVDSDECDWPMCFTTKYTDETKIIFKVFDNAESDPADPVGTAIAILSQLKQGLGPKRESLVRDFTIPIVNSKYGYIGSVAFSFVIASPLDSTLPPPTEPQELQPEPRTALGGHRGGIGTLQGQGIMLTSARKW